MLYLDAKLAVFFWMAGSGTRAMGRVLDVVWGVLALGRA